MNRETIKWSPYSITHIDNVYFVALSCIDNAYELYLFNGFIKRFTKSTTPKEIRPKLAMINSLKEFFMKEDGDFQELDMYISRLYLSQEQKEFKNIGWKVSPTMYVLVLTKNEIYKMQGN